MDTNVLLLLTISILLAFNLNALAWHSAKEIDDGYTLGDAALEMTTSVDCLAAEYQFTRNEIIVKLRRVLSDACGIDSSAITPDVKLDDLLSE